MIISKLPIVLQAQGRWVYVCILLCLALSAMITSTSSSLVRIGECDSRYHDTNESGACKSGYLSGPSACTGLSGPEKDACNTGVGYSQQNTRQNTQDQCGSVPQAQRNACQQGASFGRDSCRDMQGANKTACENGADATNHNGTGNGNNQNNGGSCPNGTDGLGTDTGNGICASDAGRECGGVKTTLIECNYQGASGSNEGYNGLVGMLSFFSKIAFATIGIVCTVVIAAGGFMYASSSSDAGQKSRGIAMIRNASIAIGIVAIITAALEFLSPIKIFSTLSPLLSLWLK